MESLIARINITKMQFFSSDSFFSSLSLRRCQWKAYFSALLCNKSKWFNDIVVFCVRSFACLNKNDDISAICKQTTISWNPVYPFSFFTYNLTCFKKVFAHSISEWWGHATANKTNKREWRANSVAFKYSKINFLKIG